MSHPADRLWPPGVAPAWLRSEWDQHAQAEAWEASPEGRAFASEARRLGADLARLHEAHLFSLLKWGGPAHV